MPGARRTTAGFGIDLAAFRAASIDENACVPTASFFTRHESEISGLILLPNDQWSANERMDSGAAPASWLWSIVSRMS